MFNRKRPVSQNLINYDEEDKSDLAQQTVGTLCFIFTRRKMYGEKQLQTTGEYPFLSVSF